MKAPNIKRAVKYPLIKAQRFFLCLYFFSIHFEQWDPFFTGIDYLITKITIVCYIVISIFGYTGLSSLKRYNKFILPITIIFLIQTISGYIYQRSNYNEYFSLIFFLSVITFILMLLQQTKDNLAIVKALDAFTWGGIFLTLFFLTDIETEIAHINRVSVFGVNHNLQAINLSVVLLIMINRLFNKVKTNKFINFLYLIFIPLILFFIASTGSRSGFVSLVIGLTIMVFFKRIKNPFTKINSLILGIAAITSLSYYFFSNEVIGYRIDDSINTGDLSNRDVYWEGIITLFDISPYFGIGETGYAYETEHMFGTYTSSHNVFLEVLIMGGLVSFIFLLLFLFRIIKKTYLNQDLVSLVFMAPILVTFLVGHPFGTRLIWGLFVVIISYEIKNKFHKT